MYVQSRVIERTGIVHASLIEPLGVRLLPALALLPHSESSPKHALFNVCDDTLITDKALPERLNKACPMLHDSTLH